MRFEFAYMAARRTTGKKAPPPRADKLLGEFEAAVDDAGVKAPFIGGKSLGARVASMCADKLVATGKIGGLVCLAYPFHPTGRPDSLRTAHLMDIDFPLVLSWAVLITGVIWLADVVLFKPRRLANG